MSEKRAGDTVEIPKPVFTPESMWPYTGSAEMQVDLGALSHQGLVRKANEDHYLVARFSRAMEQLLTNMPADHLPGRAEEVAYGLFDGIFEQALRRHLFGDPDAQSRLRNQAGRVLDLLFD